MQFEQGRIKNINKKIWFLAILLAVLLLGICVKILIGKKETPRRNKEYANQENKVTPEEKSPQPPKMQIDTNKTYRAVLFTSEGEITINLHAKQTPITVNNFVHLARKGFYNKTIFHRIIKGFMIQGGDPQGNGTGGPGYKFDDEPFEEEYKRGVVAMANSGPNTNGSQFFIIHQDTPLPKNYVIFGQVIEGMDIVDKIAEVPVKANAMGENSTPANPITVESVKIVE